MTADEAPRLQLAQMLADLSDLAVADPAAARALLAVATPPTPPPPDEDLGRASALLRFCAERDRLALQDGAGLARPRADVAAVEARYASLKAARVVDGSGGPASDEQRRA